MNQFMLRIFSIFIVVGLLLHSSVLSHAAEEYTGRPYQHKLIKSRAEMGYTNRGTVLYKYKEIGSYNDSLQGEEIGNIDVKSSVREVHNVVVIHDDVKSKKDELAVGQVEIDKSHSGIDVENEVVIDGDINASGESMELGTVRMGKNGRNVNVDTSVKTKGGIDAR